MPNKRPHIDVPDGYKLVFRRFKRDPKTGKLLPPPPGCRAWPFVVPIEDAANENK